MNSEKKMLFLSLATAVLGITVLLFLGQNTAIEMKINQISKSDEGKKILTTGRIVSLKETEKTVFFTLMDQNKINAVMFNPSIEERAMLRKSFSGKPLKIIGKISKYKGSLEIIAEKIEQ